jgi:hypothetical protein
LNGLSEAFKILNDNTHREARRVVHTDKVTLATRKILEFDDKTPQDKESRESLRRHTTDMEQIGTMAPNKLFD